MAGSRLRGLLTRLAVDAGRPVAPAELVDAVWPDDAPADITNSLQSLVSRLRRALGDATLIQQLPNGYRLAVEATAVDAVVFADLAATGHERLRAGDPLGARSALTEALALWRGAPLVDADDAPYRLPWWPGGTTSGWLRWATGSTPIWLWAPAPRSSGNSTSWSPPIPCTNSLSAD